MQLHKTSAPRRACAREGDWAARADKAKLKRGLIMDIVGKNDPRLKQVWKQDSIPVVLRRVGKGERLRVRLPFAVDNANWLRGGKHTRPAWQTDIKCWEIPKAWFNDFVNRALVRFGRLYVIQPYREQEKCSPSCLNAQGHECECSCMGENHGAGNDGSWFEVTEAFASRWGKHELACRLMVAL